MMWHGIALSACGQRLVIFVLVASNFKVKFALLLVTSQGLC